MWMLPTRSRPNNIRRFLKAWHDTARTTLRWYVRIDKDDPLLDDYLHLEWPEPFNVIVGERISPCDAFNECFSFFPSERFYGLFADDVVPESHGWDGILQTEAGSDGVAYGNDGINGAALATHCAVGGDLVRELGWVSLPGLKRLYTDNVLTEIARARGVLRYRPDVKLTHFHFSVGAPMDEVYRKPSAREDRRIYEEWKRSQLPA